MQNNNRISLLQRVLGDLEKLNDADYQKYISDFLEEQPFLLGLLYNLDEDFPENEHDYLVKATVMITLGFKAMQMQVGMVQSDVLSQVLEEKIALYDNLASQGDFDFKTLTTASDNPDTLASFISFFDQVDNLGMPKDPIRRLNFIMMLDVIISATELSLVLPENDKEKRDA
ncbi:MAG: hypothetical protein LAT76_05970 [Schleiferiaceae bacterium]|nr:hypothetical protein [Schleiferiaceae bacterium]